MIDIYKELANSLNITRFHNRYSGLVRYSVKAVRILDILLKNGFIANYRIGMSDNKKIWGPVIFFRLKKVGSRFAFRRCIAYSSLDFEIRFRSGRVNFLNFLNGSFAIVSSPGFGFLTLLEARSLKLSGKVVFRILI